MQSVDPWLRTWLINAAETYGANTGAIPLHEKGRKAQIVEFLTFGVENEDSAIWALLSDKALLIPIKFSKEAVAAYNRANGKSITESRTALVVIKKFKPMSTRVPNRRGGMSADARLVLHCDSVTLLGSVGQSRWGNPEDVESDTELREWSEGLRKDGGAGNVLKERKKAKEAPPLPAKRPITQRKIDVVQPPPRASTSTEHSKNPVHEYTRRWKDSILDPLAFVRPQPAPRKRKRTPEPGPAKDARYLGSSSPSEKYSVASSPISNWEPTPEKPSRARIASESPSPADRSSATSNRSRTSASKSPYSTNPSSSAPSRKSVSKSPSPADRPSSAPSRKSVSLSPSPADRPSPAPSRKSVSLSPSPVDRPSPAPDRKSVSKSPNTADPSPAAPSRKTAFKSPSPVDLSSPSFGRPSSYLTAPTPAQRQRRVVTTSPVPFVRKVAPPPTPPPVGSGPERVLAPNSDQSSQSQAIEEDSADILVLSSQPFQPARVKVKDEDVDIPIPSVRLFRPTHVAEEDANILVQPSHPSQSTGVKNEDVDIVIPPSQLPRTKRVRETVDVDMELDDDDDQTSRELFGSPCWPEPPKKRRKVDHAGSIFDCVRVAGKAVVTWKRVLDVLEALRR